MNENPGVPEPTHRVDLTRLVVSPDAIACLSEDNARRLLIVPLALIEQAEKKYLLMASLGVLNSGQQDRIRRHLGQHVQLKLVCADRDQLLATIDKCYQHEHDLDSLLAMCSVMSGIESRMESAGDYHIHLIEALLREACRRRVSDIHFSPVAEGLLIRFRVDGVLEVVTTLHKKVISGFNVRIKVLAQLDIAESRLPQDGQFNQYIDGNQVDFRVSVFPTVHGENIVLRVIKDQQAINLHSLCLSVDTNATIQRLLHRPDGMIVVCGPTGAGKSTTLFALLGEKDQTALNIMALEDPVEHRESGIRQSSIDPLRSFDYQQGVKAMLRQDPDVLLIGEVRDPGSCEMALRAATSGHQVLTTIHAANAHAALTRLRELDAQPHILAACLSAIIAQRLVRKICTVCYQQDQACNHCHGSGYYGRQAILEVLCVDEKIRQLIAKEADIAEIEAASWASGFISLRKQAQHWIDARIVSMEELNRVLGKETLQSTMP